MTTTSLHDPTNSWFVILFSLQGPERSDKCYHMLHSDKKLYPTHTGTFTILFITIECSLGLCANNFYDAARLRTIPQNLERRSRILLFITKAKVTFLLITNIIYFDSFYNILDYDNLLT